MKAPGVDGVSFVSFHGPEGALREAERFLSFLDEQAGRG